MRALLTCTYLFLFCCIFFCDHSEMQSRIVDLIGRVTHDEITAELLRLNDELNNLFLRYQRYEKNRDPKNMSTPSAILGAALRGSNGIIHMHYECYNFVSETYVFALISDARGKDSLIDLEDTSQANEKLSNKFSGLCKFFLFISNTD